MLTRGPNAVVPWSVMAVVFVILFLLLCFFLGGDLGLQRGRKMTLRGVALDPQSISLVALMATRFVTDLMFLG